MADSIKKDLARQCYESRREVNAALPPWEALGEAERVVLYRTIEFWNELEVGTHSFNELLASTRLAWSGHSSRYASGSVCPDPELSAMLTTYLALRAVGFTR